MPSEFYLTYDPMNWYWVVGGDETKVYSSRIGGYLPAGSPSYLAWLEEGNRATRIASEDELIAVLREQAPNGLPEALRPPRRLSTYRIVRRLEEAGLLAAAQALLDANITFKWRFTTTIDVAVDDADLVAGLHAIGADVDAILAPE